MVCLGIDPGAKGAFAYILPSGTIEVYPYEEGLFLFSMKNIGNHKWDCMCCLENVHAMPKQGVVSMFNFGKNFGFIQGVLRAHSIPYELVRPQEWKKEFGITKDKNTSIEACKELFPEVSLRRTERCKKDDDGMAEALLMAEYCKRRLI